MAKETKVLPCSCKNEYQDKTYGEGKRLHNPGAGKDSIAFKCTVCKAKH